MTKLFDYRAVLIELCAICCRALSREGIMDEMLDRMRRRYGELCEELTRAMVTPVRQTDLVEIAGGLCRTTGLARTLPRLEGRLLHLCDIASALTSMEIAALCERGGAPSALGDLLPVYFEGVRDDTLRDVFLSLYDTHLAIARARLFLG